MNLLKIDISWAQLRGLHQIYETGWTRTKLFSNSYIKRLKSQKRLLRCRVGNSQIIDAAPKYKDFYEITFLPSYNRYLDFFAKTGIKSDGKRSYSTYDLETLIYIDEHKSTLKAGLTTERIFSAQLFKEKGSKYLENNISVRKAVLKILDIETFPHKDPKVQQWRLVVDCMHPRAVILCENLSILKQADIVRKLKVEAWYVGGNNIAILKFLSDDKLQLPIYYMCDWDCAGLTIYSRIKNIIRDKGAAIKILRPYNIAARLPVDSSYHKSDWQSDLPFSGLIEEDFDAEDIDLIKQLISEGKWIEEESQDFETLLQYNKVIVD